MSYNLLLDTNFQKIGNRWKLTNCTYDNGYLVSNSTLYSIEQLITIPNPTKLYFSIDYICLDPNVKNVWVGIQSNSTLEANKKKPKLHRRSRLSVIDDIKVETIKLIFIVEAKTENTKIYIDSPLLIDLNYLGKAYWAKWALDKQLKFRQGFCYQNIYKQNEITLSNSDFQTSNLDRVQAKSGIIVTLNPTKYSAIISCNLSRDSYYLAKLDYEEINQYGQIYFKYGEILSENIDKEQIYIIFKSNENNLHLILENDQELKYSVNLKHLLIVKLDDLNIDMGDIPHIPFVEN